MKHCKSCKRFFGTGFGLTTKRQWLHKPPSRVCGMCGTGILEYGEEAAPKFQYVITGTFNQPGAFPPKSEFFCKDREEWMPEIPNIFHKQEIKG